MDIFTTALTRVVPIPIKPANNKVKAPSKTAGVGQLEEDVDHLENHDNYFDDKNVDAPSSENENEQGDKKSLKSNDLELSNTALKSAGSKLIGDQCSTNSSKGITESKDGTKHLDLYV